MKDEASIEILRQSTLFSRLSDDALQVVAEAAAERSVPRANAIFFEGDPGDAFFVIASGSVKVYVTSVDADEMVLATLLPGDSLGEVTVLDGGPRSASAETLEDTQLLAFSRSTLLTLMQEHPAIADDLLRAMGQMVRRLTHQAADFVFLDLEGRVAKALLSFAEQRGDTDAENGSVQLDLALTQADLGRMVGGSRQRVNQVLRGLEDRGYVEVEGRTVRIIDVPRLQRRAKER